eukprot:CAMPEP_0118682990 /NCGR_PEP_ID=MMETSP0800-20121206/5789_1 /TAXON_ID=210618 ORGANISM="Striatella unipunctata, Strain CCMP2910" /NCGR_SAMPLE_ID=MMETSP0800 /ASSEMBLY_ACC=CAM_ASM_000638 /LENGTH=77 /DNA_ID=CAMNT_0006579435 /DNA_START=706 /DNA_END=936 /DNA_ORIENTATION=+
MEDITETIADAFETCWEDFCLYNKITQLLQDEGSDITCREEDEESSGYFLPSDVTTTNVEGSSMLRDVIVEELARQG